MFACGNLLHVHDLVDFVSQEAQKAGENAALYLQGARAGSRSVRLEGKNGVRYTVPQSMDPENMDETVTVRFRVAQPYRDAALAAYAPQVRWSSSPCAKRSCPQAAKPLPLP